MEIEIEIEIEIKIELEKIQENNEKLMFDLDLILLKNKEEIVYSDDKNIEFLLNNLKEKILDNNEEVINKKEFFFEKE